MLVFFLQKNKIDLLNILKHKLTVNTFNTKIRFKPNEPLVDISGNFLGIRNSNNNCDTSLQEDLDNSSTQSIYNILQL